MKTFLCALCAFTAAFTAQGQIVLNEIYTDPGSSAGRSEFIELYNSSTAKQNLDCFTILTYWEDGSEKGWYVIDLPNITLDAKKWYVLAGSSTFSVPARANIAADLNWNAMSADSYLRKFRLNGNDYEEIPPWTPADLLADVVPAGTAGHHYFVLLYQNGALINGFHGGGANGTLPVGIKTLPSLQFTSAGTCNANYDISFANIGSVEFVNQVPSPDNGYTRTSDGKCASWSRTTASITPSPGASNGSAAGVSGSLVTSQTLSCNTSPGYSTVTYSISGITGNVSVADDFPIEIQVYYDNGTVPGKLDGGDLYQTSEYDYSVSDPSRMISVLSMQSVILVYRTKRGCFDKVVSLANGCSPLPVGLVNFTAVRDFNTVKLNWQTTFEQNSQGFYIEKNTGGNWLEVGYVPSKAHNGSSLDEHDYDFSETNTETGVSQYRIREAEQGGRFRYSIVRAVYGIGMPGRVIVFPNPSADGSVNVVFEATKKIRTAILSDLSGHVVRQWKNYGAGSIQIKGLAPGIYSLLVEVPETGDRQLQRIVVAGH